MSLYFQGAAEILCSSYFFNLPFSFTYENPGIKHTRSHLHLSPLPTSLKWNVRRDFLNQVILIFPSGPDALGIYNF